jgi:hypothetical protein
MMNYPAAPGSGISASLRQATGYQPEYFLYHRLFIFSETIIALRAFFL